MKCELFPRRPAAAEIDAQRHRCRHRQREGQQNPPQPRVAAPGGHHRHAHTLHRVIKKSRTARVAQWRLVPRQALRGRGRRRVGGKGPRARHRAERARQCRRRQRRHGPLAGLQTDFCGRHGSPSKDPLGLLCAFFHATADGRWLDTKRRGLERRRRRAPPSACGGAGTRLLPCTTRMGRGLRMPVGAARGSGGFVGKESRGQLEGL